MNLITAVVACGFADRYLGWGPWIWVALAVVVIFHLISMAVVDTK